MSNSLATGIFQQLVFFALNDRIRESCRKCSTQLILVEMNVEVVGELVLSV
jgi:hypothetical protein